MSSTFSPGGPSEGISLASILNLADVVDVVTPDDRSVSWKVFNSEAELIHPVDLPGRFRPVDIDERAVAGIWTDGLGAEP